MLITLCIGTNMALENCPSINGIIWESVWHVSVGG